jgi:hypothetical protein
VISIKVSQELAHVAYEVHPEVEFSMRHVLNDLKSAVALAS